VLAETEATQISKLEEFVKDKFHFVSGIQKTKKETESIVDWLSQQIARATYEVLYLLTLNSMGSVVFRNLLGHLI
jgi:DNA repair protein RadC